MTITDTVVSADTFTISFPVNIPAAVGGNTAFVGFTAGTGSLTATQEILTWAYSTGTSSIPDFPTFASPASQTVNPGNSTTYTAKIGAQGGFTGVVNLAATGLPAGASASFSPASVTGSGTSTLTVTTAGSTPAGTSTITMTGTSGSLTHGTAASLVVAIPVVPDFSIVTSPASQTVNPGNSTTYTVTVGALNGFTGAVNLAASGLPSGATASFSPATVTGSGTSTLTVTTAGNTPVGTSTITITGASGSLTHTTNINLVVQTSAALIDFGSGFSAVRMQFNGHTKLNGTRLGLTDSTTLTQVASAFWTTAVNVQSFTNDFTFQLTNPNADGFTFTIQSVGLTAMGNSGGSLGYQPIPSSAAVKFDLYNGHGEGNNSTGLYLNGASPSVPATTLGGGVNLHSGDIFQVHMTYDGTNLTMTITDTVVSADTFTISFPVNIPAAVGVNTAFVGFTAGCGSFTATQEILTWAYSTGTSSIPDFSTFASPASQTVNPGNSTTYTVSIGAQGGFTGVVSLAATGLPAGASASFAPASVTGSETSTLTVITAGSTPAGTSTITMTGTSRSLTHGTAVSLVVAIPVVPDFSIATSLASQTVNPGNSTTYTVTVGALNGFTGAVNLAASGLPSGATASFSPATVTGSGTSTLTVTTAGNTPVGTSTITITGATGSLTHTTNINLVVQTSTALIDFGSGFSAVRMEL